MKVTFNHDSYTRENEDYGLRGSKYEHIEADSVTHDELKQFSFGNNGVFINSIVFESALSDYEISNICTPYCDLDISKIDKFSEQTPLIQELILARMEAEASGIANVMFGDFVGNLEEVIKKLGDK